ASPMKTSRVSIRDRVINTEIPSQGACRLALACAISSPKDGEPRGSPKPRKSREVRVVMAPVRIKGIKVRVATMALGSMCRNIIRPLDAPRALAARTYSKLREIGRAHV